MSTQTIGLIQTAVSDDPDRNLARTLEMARTAIAKGARILCLQELYRAPYFPQYEDTDASAYAETIPGPSTEAFSALAREHGVVIVVPLYERTASGEHYNTAVVIDADGRLLPAYRKVHVPYDPLFYEKNYFRPGDRYRVYDTRHGRIAVLICYDQWFPEAARTVALQGAEIIFYPTAIGHIAGEEPPEGDWREAWETVQRGHAIANSVHVAAVNRVGDEGDIRFFGSSFVADAFGNVLARAGGTGEEILIVEVDLAGNEAVREGWGFLENRRPETYGALTRRFLPGRTPAGSGYRMPAEWEPHDAVWLSWPHDRETFPDLAAVERTYIEIIAALRGSEPVDLLVTGEAMRTRIVAVLEEEGVDTGGVRFHFADYADVWFRDYGPTFLINPKAESLAMVNWTFNAWGEKYTELMGDTRVPLIMNREMELPLFTPGIVLEGGSVEVNGRGTVIVTEACLLNPNRNPHLSREEIEAYLEAYLGAGHVIWLTQGIAGDDTDGHVDDIARFVDPTTVVCALEENEDDENHALLQENYALLRASTDQDGNPLTVIPLPMPGRVGGAERLPASYANFYVGNTVVLVPVFKHPNDEIALARIRQAFPDREVAGIDCTAMVEGLGAIHCISQQQPSVVPGVTCPGEETASREE
ncbi:agmatine deiminase family protein [Methanoculleus oceani]|uniref:Peptidyl-arginine deiminase n=1 Tax=Methanoculleus oceani TaxID=2184756 RepID=A0ABD4THF7_9EURY|nr:agmatine deiminase family protein [Methanoculleus sp. CWC-02]MCM2466536.1 peptidyl-arginine deiminase [Methanoculleus sp. CWC-02]